MNRLKFKTFLWTLLLITIFLKSVQPASVPKSSTSKATKSPSRSTTATVAPSRSTTSKSSSSRNTPRPKNSKRTTTTTTTTTTPSSVETAIKDIMKTQLNSSSSGSKKKQNTRTTTTTTLSPLEIMNRLYQQHGMGGQSIHSSHSHSHSHSSTPQRKPQPDTSSSMDDIYRLHALAMSQAHNTHKVSSSSSSSGTSGSSSSYSSSSSSSNKPSSSSSNSMENIYQKHSSMPSSMHHIMSQHSSSSSRPQKTKIQPLKESSPSSLSTFMQPLLKQLTPVGAGISVVLAPLLLFHGFLTFFSNISQYLNGFSKIILPHRKPTGGQLTKPVGAQISSQNQEYFQNLGHAYLKRQPRDWLEHLQNMKEVHDITELIVKAIKETEIQEMNN